MFDVPPLGSTEVLDARTVRFTYPQPAPAFRIMPGADLPIIPRHIWEGITDPRTNAQSLPVGSGPYKLVEIVPDQLYRFEANETYFKGPPAAPTGSASHRTAPRCSSRCWSTPSSPRTSGPHSSSASSSNRSASG